MASTPAVYRFGRFELDSARRTLRAGLEPVPLTSRHADLLLVLVANAGSIVAKDVLHTAGWGVVAVTDSSLVHAIGDIKKVLGNQPDGTPYIESLSRRGYRFLAPVERGQVRHTPVALDALLAPYRAFVDGRAALERLDLGGIARAREAFTHALTTLPDDPIPHVGLANAYVLQFESTRCDAEPDLTALQLADRHAHEAIRLAPASGDVLTTFAFVRHRLGHSAEAIAAARKAVAIDPNDWHHHLRLAAVSWGRLRRFSAERALELCPHLALAHWFASTVYVAQQTFSTALEQLRAGCALQDAQVKETGRFRAVGLHLLHALVLAAQGRDDEALQELSRELALEDPDHIYARECSGNTWYTRGALHLRHRRCDEASVAFERALQYLPNHALAKVGLAATASTPVISASIPKSFESAMVLAAQLALQDRHDDASRVCGALLSRAEPGSAGWLIPVEPLLQATRHRHAWATTLAALGDRAL